MGERGIYFIQMIDIFGELEVDGYIIYSGGW